METAHPNSGDWLCITDFHNLWRSRRRNKVKKMNCNRLDHRHGRSLATCWRAVDASYDMQPLKDGRRNDLCTRKWIPTRTRNRDDDQVESGVSVADPAPVRDRRPTASDAGRRTAIDGSWRPVSPVQVASGRREGRPTPGQQKAQQQHRTTITASRPSLFA